MAIWLQLILFGLIFVRKTLSFNVDDRPAALKVIRLNPPGRSGKSNYAGYDIAAQVNSDYFRLVVSAPKYQSSEEMKNGAVFCCDAIATKQSSDTHHNSSDWLSNITCQVTLDGSSLTIGASQRQTADFLGTTLLVHSKNTFTVCAPGREKQCGDAGTYLPGACYHGSLNESIRLLQGWGEIRCFENFVDVIFLIDSTESISDTDFEEMKRILINISSLFEDSIGTATQIGILQYGTLDADTLNYLAVDSPYYRNPTRLGDCTSVGCLQSAVRSNMSHLRAANTYTAYAIMRAAKLDFAASKNRNISKKILVLVTDGAALDEDQLMDSYRLTQANNITVYAIGVGEDVNQYKDQLRISANGGRSDDRVLTASNYNTLSEELQNLTRVISSQAGAEATGTSGSTLEFAQFGISGHVSRQTGEIFLGAVGAYSWSGTVVKYNAPDAPTAKVPDFAAIKSIFGNDSENSYLGYSMTSGYYDGEENLYVAVSAPKHRFIGSVVIYKSSLHLNLSQAVLVSPSTLQRNRCSMKEISFQKLLGIYFGASMISVDLNGDHKDDLIVSAPLYSGEHYDEGRVFVYAIEDDTPLEDWASSSCPLVIPGDRSAGGRFGTSIASAGDLNLDEFNDIVISAPFADNDRGAIYVYYGGSKGLDPANYQKISSVMFGGQPLYSFGYALQGGLDVDGNGYPDLIVSAPQNDSAVILRTRPLVKLNASLTFEPSVIEVMTCFSRPHRNCLELTACVTAVGDAIEDVIDVNITILLDPRLTFTLVNESTSGSDRSVQNIEIRKTNGEASCRSFQIYVRRNINNLNSTMIAVMTYQLSRDHLLRILSSVSKDNSHQVTSSASFYRNCGADGICTTDLVIEGALRLPVREKENDLDVNPDGRTLVVAAETINQPITVKVNLSNSGEVAYRTRVVVTYPTALSWSQVLNVTSSVPGSSDCIVDQNRETTQDNIKMKTLLYSYNQHLGNIMPSSAWCSFTIVISHGNLGAFSEISTLYLRIHATADYENDSDITNNDVMFAIPVLYLGDVIVSRTSPDPLISLRTEKNMNEDNNAQFQFQLESLGFARIPKSSVTLFFPAFFTPIQPLLYLYKVNCSSIEGNPLCVCDHSSVNRFNLSIVNGQIATDSYVITNVSVIKTRLLSCNSTNENPFCDKLVCDITNLDFSDIIQLTATFKVWSQSFPLTENETNVVLRSGFEFSSQKSPSTIDELRNPIIRLVTADAIVRRQEDLDLLETAVPFWIYLAGAGGGFLLLLLTILLLYKFGFFRRGYYELQQDYLRHKAVDGGKHEIYENVLETVDLS